MSKNIFYRLMAFSIAALMSPAVFATEQCEALPDCASIGYTFTAQECGSLLKIKCPFGDAYFCSKANCVNSAGYYDTCPTGAQCPEEAKVDGCYVPTECADGWTSYLSNADRPPFFIYGDTETFKVGTTDKTCQQIIGCVFDTSYHFVASLAECPTNAVCLEQSEYNMLWEGYKCYYVNCSGNYEWSGTSCVRKPQEDCSSYTTANKWIESYSGSYNNPTNISRCKALGSYYPTNTTATCGGKTYRKCDAVTCENVATYYSTSFPGSPYDDVVSRTSSSGSTIPAQLFYARVYNTGGYSGLTCYNKSDTLSWTSTSVASPADCSLDVTSQQANAFYIASTSMDQTCYVLDRGIVSKGISFTTGTTTTMGGYGTGYNPTTCTLTKNSKTYVAKMQKVEGLSHPDAFENIRLILETPSDDRSYVYFYGATNLYECCGSVAYSLGFPDSYTPYRYMYTGGQFYKEPISGGSSVSAGYCGNYY